MVRTDAHCTSVPQNPLDWQTAQGAPDLEHAVVELASSGNGRRSSVSVLEEGEGATFLIAQMALSF